MLRKDAIVWCQENIKTWPRWTNSPAPEGWRWIVRNLPYQMPIYLLTNAIHQEIDRTDV